MRASLLCLVMALLLPVTSLDAAPPRKPARPPVDPLTQAIQTWGKDGPATRNVRRFLDGGGRATWLQTPIGPVAVLEGEALVVITPKGKSHWWLGNPSRMGEPPSTPLGDPTEGVDGAALGLSTPEGPRVGGVPSWPGLPVLRAGKDRIWLALDWEWPLDRRYGQRLVTVTRDRVVWDEPDVVGTALVDLDGDKTVDRARLEGLNFGPCWFLQCHAQWWEFDRGGPKSTWQDGGPAARAAYVRLAADASDTVARADGDCHSLHGWAVTLFRYTLLAKADPAPVRTLVGQLQARWPACAQARTLPADASEEDEADEEIRKGGAALVACLQKPGPLDQARWQACVE